MASKKNRKTERAEVALIARYRSPTAFEFVAEACSDLSTGGMFIASPHPAPPGTLLKLECEVGDGQAIIKAVARVVWLREEETAGGPKGMGVKFVKLEPGSREIVQAVLDNPGLRQSMIPGAPSSRASTPDAVGAPPSSVPSEAPTPSAAATSAFRSAAASVARAPSSAPAPAATDSDSFRFDASDAPRAVTREPSEPVREAPEPARASWSDAVREPSEPARESPQAEPEASEPVHASSSEPSREASEPPREASEPPPEASLPAPQTSHEIESEPAPEPLRRRTGAEGLRDRLRQSKLFDDLQRRPTSSQPPEPDTGARLEAEATEQSSEASAYTGDAPRVAATGETAAGADRLFISTAGDVEAAAAEERLDSLPPDVPVPERVSKRTKIIVGAVVAWGIVLGVIATRDFGDAGKDKAPAAAATVEASKPAPPAPPPAPVPATPEPPPPPTEAVAGAAAAVAPEPAAAPAPPALPPEYVLDVVTIPAGARVSAGGQTVTTPGQLRLGLLEAPVQIAASKQGFVRVVSTIDRREFQPQGDEMHATLTLALVEEGASASTTPATPPPAPERPKVARKPRPPEPAPAAPSPPAAPAEDGVRTAIATTKAASKGGAEAAGGETPLQKAIACLSKGDNDCVIAALDGKAGTARELELLIETYRATGRGAKAEQLMETYVRRYPEQRRAASYQRMLETQ